MSSALDSYRQVALLALGQAGFFAALDAAVLVNIALQRFKVFVVKNGDQACASIEFPKGTFGCSKPDFWEVLNDDVTD